jgi:hypothetical protein
MKLTREDIEKYGTDDEVVFLTEGVLRDIFDWAGPKIKYLFNNKNKEAIKDIPIAELKQTIDKMPEEKKIALLNKLMYIFEKIQYKTGNVDKLVTIIPIFLAAGGLYIAGSLGAFGDALTNFIDKITKNHDYMATRGFVTILAIPMILLAISILYVGEEGSRKMRSLLGKKRDEILQDLEDRGLVKIHRSHKYKKDPDFNIVPEVPWMGKSAIIGYKKLNREDIYKYGTKEEIEFLLETFKPDPLYVQLRNSQQRADILAYFGIPADKFPPNAQPMDIFNYITKNTVFAEKVKQWRKENLGKKLDLGMEPGPRPLRIKP